MTSASITGRPWHAPVGEFVPVGRRWDDWRRFLEHRSGRTDARMQRVLERVLDERERLESLEDQALDAALTVAQHGQRRRPDHDGSDGIAPALAAAAVAADRMLSMRAYPMQLLAVLGMHEGCAVQMMAGEGKTLAVALFAALEGWRGRVCHVVTANDYLAARDGELMSAFYGRCGLRVSSVTNETTPEQQRAAYDADVVYATGKQLLADHLRDQLLLGGATAEIDYQLHGMRPGTAPQPASRGVYSAIVDEADSVLIDDATTPLIISAPEPSTLMQDAVLAARGIIDELEPGVHYLLDRAWREVIFTEAGERVLDARMHLLAKLWHARERRDELLTQAVLARDLFERDRHYIVRDDEVVIVDENTGRAMPGRSWSYGLHQAIEAREDLPITPPTRTLARMSFQAFFRRYRRLAGASGTLQGTRAELWNTYRLLPMTIPTRVPSRLAVEAPRCYATRLEKWDALIEAVLEVHRSGLPVLVGTQRISDSEALEEELALRGVACSVLNAKQHAEEAQIIERAGEARQVTVATNMAGRGTDIKVPAAVIARGGLQVFMLDPHESERVDWQLFGRAGRHGEPGVAVPFASSDDDLLRLFLPLWAKPLLWAARYRPLLTPLLRRLLPIGQARAQGRAHFARKQLQKREVMQRKQLSFAGDDAFGSMGRRGASEGGPDH